MRKGLLKMLVLCTVLVGGIGIGACGGSEGEEQVSEEQEVSGEQEVILNETNTPDVEKKFGEAVKTLEGGIAISNDKISSENYKYVTCPMKKSSPLWYCPRMIW